MNKQVILLVDDDHLLQKRLRAVFENGGYEFLSVSNAEQLDATLSTHNVDLVLMDVVLPDANGFDLMRKLRKKTNIPIIMLTQKADIDDRLTGLQEGADDYIIKPFNSAELLARVEVVQRRAGGKDVISGGVDDAEAIGGRFQFGKSTFDTATDVLSTQCGQKVKLTSRESLLLLAFLRNSTKRLTRSWLQYAVNQREWNPADRSLDVLVGRLRKKMSIDPTLDGAILSERSTGYRFTMHLENVS